MRFVVLRLLSLSWFFVLPIILTAQSSSCRAILNQAKKALRAGDTELALRKLQDTEICDRSNTLSRERLQVQKSIFEQINQQKEEALQAKERADQALQQAEEEKQKAERLTRASNNAITALKLNEQDPTLALRMAEMNYQLFPESSSAAGIFEELLNDTEQGKALRVYEKGHAKWLTTACFSPDGQLILTGAEDNKAIIWDIKGNQKTVLRSSFENDAWVLAGTFSPDGKTIATAGTWGYGIRLWNLKGEELLHFPDYQVGINAIKFTPDGQYLLSGDNDGRIILWSLSGEIIREYKGNTERINSLFISADGQFFLSCSNDKNAILWRFSGEIEERITDPDPNKFITHGTLSPDGNFILTNWGNEALRLFNRSTGEILKIPAEKGTQQMAFSPNGMQFATRGNYGGDIRIWSTEGQQVEVISKQGFSLDQKAFSFSPDGQSLLLIHSTETFATIIDLLTKERVNLSGHADGVEEIIFSAKGNRLFVGDYKGGIHVWDQGGNVSSFNLDESFLDLLELKLIDNGQKLFIADDGYFYTLNPDQPNQILDSLELDYDYSANDVSVADDGSFFVIGTDEGFAEIWSLEGKMLHRLEGHENEIDVVDISPNGEYILTGSRDRNVKLWTAVGEEVHSFKHNEEVTALTFSPDGKKIVAGSYLGDIKVWNLEGEEEIEIRGNGRFLTTLAVSKNNDYILAGSVDKAATLWRFSGEKLRTFKGHTEPITTVVFSQDGNYILTGSKDQTIRYYPLKDIKSLSLADQSKLCAPTTSLDGRYLFLGQGPNIIICDLADNRLEKIRTKHIIHEVKVSSNQEYLLTIGASDGSYYNKNKSLQLTRLIDEQEILFYSGIVNNPSFAFSPDNQSFIYSQGDSTCTIRNLTGQKIKQFNFGAEYLDVICYSPDGNNILLVSSDFGAKLYSNNGGLVRHFEDKDADFKDAWFSADGRYIVIISYDGIHQIWRVIDGQKMKADQLDIPTGILEGAINQHVFNDEENRSYLYNFSGAEKIEITTEDNSDYQKDVYSSVDKRYLNRVFWRSRSVDVGKAPLFYLSTGLKKYSIAELALSGLTFESSDSLDWRKRQKEQLEYQTRLLKQAKDLPHSSYLKILFQTYQLYQKQDLIFDFNLFLSLPKPGLLKQAANYFWMEEDWNKVQKILSRHQEVSPTDEVDLLLKIIGTKIPGAINREEILELEDEEFFDMISNYMRDEKYALAKELSEARLTQEDNAGNRLILYMVEAVQGIDRLEDLLLVEDLNQLEIMIDELSYAAENTSNKVEKLFFHQTNYRLVQHTLKLTSDSKYNSIFADYLIEYAWQLLLVTNFQEAKEIVEEGLALNPNDEYGITVLAPAYVLTGSYEEGRALYKKWQDKPFTSSDKYERFADMFLNDLKYLEQNDLIPLKYKEDMKSIKSMLSY